MTQSQMPEEIARLVADLDDEIARRITTPVGSDERLGQLLVSSRAALTRAYVPEGEVGELITELRHDIWMLSGGGYLTKEEMLKALRNADFLLSIRSRQQARTALGEG